MQTERAIVIHERLASFDQVQVLLHLGLAFIGLLLEFVLDLGQSLVVCFLLLLLLALGAVGHADVAVVGDLFLELFHLIFDLLD